MPAAVAPSARHGPDTTRRCRRRAAAQPCCASLARRTVLPSLLPTADTGGVMRVSSPDWISRAALATLALGLLAVAGCSSTTPIKTVLDDPGRFDGKTVRIAG